MSESDGELDPEVEVLLDAASGGDDPSDADALRVRAAVAAAVAAGAGTGAAALSGSGAAGSTAAGAGGAAHLPGMVASMTTLPVFGVPVQSKALSGQDSLLSIVQMPAGIPVGTLAIGQAGATNAALLAAAVLALSDTDLADRLDAHRITQSGAVMEAPVD